VTDRLRALRDTLSASPDRATVELEVATDEILFTLLAAAEDGCWADNILEESGD
jgi:hypothetical protein